MIYQLFIIDIYGNKHLIGEYAKRTHLNHFVYKILYCFEKNGYYINKGTVFNEKDFYDFEIKELPIND